MLYKTLNNGIKIPSIGFGVFQLKGQECIDAVYNAIKAGYRLIDTAEGYENEAEVGIGIARAVADGLVKRHELLIGTKISVHHPIGYKETIKSFHKSMRKLNLDYIDIYLIHYPNAMADDSWKQLNADTWKAMQDLHNQGRLRILGVSNFMIYHLEELLKTATIKPAINQIELSPVWQQREVVEYCQKNDIALQAWQPIAPIYKDWVCKKPFIKEMPLKYNKTLAQIFINYSLQKGFIPLCRSKNECRMIENIESFNFSLEKADIELLDTLQCSTTICPDISHHLWDLHEKVLNKEYCKKELYRLFGFIPLLKVKSNGENEKNYFLFYFIKLFKKKKINYNHDKLYLFGFIPIIKTKKIYAKNIKIQYIPDYSVTHKRERENKSPQWNPLKEKFVKGVLLRGDFWREKYHKLPFFKSYLMLRYILKRKISIPSLDCHITTICNLKCKNCSHYIPYYKSPNKYMLSVEKFKNNIDTILKNVDLIYNLNILGGEPLLNKDIDKFLEYADSKSQIKAIRIHTNGTIVPSEILMKKITSLKKVSFFLSNYSGNPSIKILKDNELINLLNKYNIKYYRAPKDYTWGLVPEVNLEQNITDEQNIRQYLKCNFKYSPCLSDGKIYPCALAKFIADNGYHLKGTDCIDLSTNKSIRKDFINFYKAKSFEICKCCDFTTYNSPIMPAIQIGKDN